MKAGKKTTREPEIQRKKIADIAAGLREIDRGWAYLSEANAGFIADAFDAFLSGKSKSLDNAFGVVRGRGAPKRGPLNSDVAEIGQKAVFRGNKSWKDIADETGRDVRDLQRIAKRHEDYIINELARKVVERLNAKDEERRRSTIS